MVPDQVIDRTKGIRPFTFFEGGIVCHVPFADPFDGGIGKVVRKCGHSLEGEGVRLHDKGTIICMGMCEHRVMSEWPLTFGQRDLSSAQEPSLTCTEAGEGQ